MKYTPNFKEPDSRFAAYRAFGVQKHQEKNKIKLDDVDSGLERPTAINTRSTFQSKTEQSENRKESAESNQNKL